MRAQPQPERRRGDRFRAGKRLWSAAEIARLVALYPHQSTAAVARKLRRSLSAVYGRAQILGLTKTAEYLASPEACRLRRADNPGIPYRFRKGHVPANKGLRRPGWGPGRMKDTQFKKGQKPWTWMPIGATRLVGGYLYTKVRDRRYVTWTHNWKPTHVLLWEKHRGRIPRDHVLAFRNGDRRDIRLRNLKLMSRRQNMARNTIWRRYPRPLAETIQLLGALRRRIRRSTDGEEQDRGPARPPVRDARTAEGRREADGA